MQLSLTAICEVRTKLSSISNYWFSFQIISSCILFFYSTNRWFIFSSINIYQQKFCTFSRKQKMWDNWNFNFNRFGLLRKQKSSSKWVWRYKSIIGTIQMFNFLLSLSLSLSLYIYILFGLFFFFKYAYNRVWIKLFCLKIFKWSSCFFR